MQDYLSKEKILVAIDCVIFGFDENDLKILLVKRNFEPERGNWSLIGGFLQKEEHLDDAAKRILLELTGLENVYMKQCHTFGDIHRDPVARTISVTYYALVKTQNINEKHIVNNGASWVSVSKLPTLIFDHQAMVDKASEALKNDCNIRPIGFELLPEKFTLPQLQQLYEVIFQKEIDKRNFRKKFANTDILIKLSEKETLTSRKGAFFYTFDKQKYNQSNNYNFHFEV